MHWLTPIAGVAMTADRYSQPLDCRRGATTARFQISFPATGTPVGVFKFQMSEDPRVENDLAAISGNTPLYGTSSETAKWVLVTLPSTAVIHGDATGSFAITLPGEEIATDGSAAVEAMVNFSTVPCRMRLWFDYTSGGTSSSLLKVWGGTDGE